MPCWRLELPERGIGGGVEPARGAAACAFVMLPSRTRRCCRLLTTARVLPTAEAFVDLADGLVRRRVERAARRQPVDRLQFLERPLGARAERAGTAGLLFRPQVAEADQLVLERFDFGPRANPRGAPRRCPAPADVNTSRTLRGRVEDRDAAVAVDVESLVLRERDAGPLEEHEAAPLADGLREEHRHVGVFDRRQAALERLEVLLDEIELRFGRHRASVRRWWCRARSRWRA